MSFDFAVMEPQLAPVPAKLPAGSAFTMSRVNTGPIMRCLVSVNQGVGICALRVYAYASDVEVLDLSTLRFDGRACNVGPWEPKPAREGITGPILSPAFFSDVETVPLEAYLPVVSHRRRR